jgi:outer membrane protein insertion porin family
VLSARAHFGYLGFYNNSIGSSIFERFIVGGSGINNWNFVGAEIVALRGYGDNLVSGNANVPYSVASNDYKRPILRQGDGSALFNRFVLELRYPVSLNPQATIFGVAFLEAGNAWNTIRQYNPFNLKRSAGVGVRVFLPMFGMLGLDYGYGFDRLENIPTENQQRGNIHFIIGQNF